VNHAQPCEVTFKVIQDNKLFEPIPISKFQTLSKEQLIEFIELQQKVNETIIKDNERLRRLNNELEEKTLLIDEQYITLKNKYFGKSSEKQPSPEDRRKANRGKKARKKRVLLPSERYPDAPLIEREVEFEEIPNCTCCGERLKDSGLTENTEFMTVIPKQFIVIRQKRHQYRCGNCHSELKTAPAPKRIKPGSSFSDEMVMDVALSKYCDLIPIERYAEMAGREGLSGLPANSLIEQTHYLADFVEGAYDKSKKELLEDADDKKVMHADETPHKMLEGDKKKNWHLWGFSAEKTSYFECRNTRSGDVASEMLMNFRGEYLVSDVYSGYGKALKTANKERQSKKLAELKHVYCNAHARRYFKQAQAKHPEEAGEYLKLYGKIYRLEKMAQTKPMNRRLRARRYMRAVFEEIKTKSTNELMQYSSKSLMVKAMKYFLGNYAELTRFVDNYLLPIDNNPQERQLRNPVVGRKTWYGTHSKRGAKTMAILFSLVEGCKLNKINPRNYFKSLVADLHQGRAPYTPAEFAAR